MYYWWSSIANKAKIENASLLLCINKMYLKKNPVEKT